MIAPGVRVDLTGCRGSGRTYFLQQVVERLTARLHEVVAVQGVSEFRDSPLLPLVLAGVPFPREARAAAVASVVSDLGRRSKRGLLVLVVDDWDDLDETSRGVIEALRRSHDAAVVTSRAATGTRPADREYAGEPQQSAFVIELEPLGFDELSTVVSARVKGPLDDSTLSRLFAKSGGIVGLAIAIVDAALSERRLQLANGMWRAQGELWSPLLRTIVEAHLRGLSADDRLALERIALAGAPDISECVALIGWDALERLEDAGVVHIIPTADRRIAGVFPPLIVEHFRHQRRSAHQLRLEEEVERALGRSVTTLALETGSPSEDSDAILVRLLQEQQRGLRLAARADWLRSRRAASGIRYARMLFESGAGLGDIERVLSDSAKVVDTDEDRASLTALRARWHLVSGAGLDAVAAEAKAARSGTGHYAGLLDAVLAEALMIAGRSDDDIAGLLAVPPGAPEQVAAALHESAALVGVVRGRFQDARKHQADAHRIAGYQPTNRARMLEIVAMLGDGDIEEAAATATRFLDEGKVRLDIDAVRIASYAAALCFVTQGRLLEAFEVAGLVSALGDPAPQLADFDLALDLLHVVLPYRMGESRIVATDFTASGNGPLPFMSPAWVSAHRALAAGDVGAAAGELADAAERLWNRGFRFESAMLAMEAIEANADVGLFDRWHARLAEIDGELVGLRVRFLSALVARDSEALIAVAGELVAESRFGLALSALRAVEASDGARSGRGRELYALRHEIEITADLSRLQDRRYSRSGFELSERELQVARRVVDGLTNQQIADELVVSVRTVESHVHRVMKKFGADSRHQLRGPLAGYDPAFARR